MATGLWCLWQVRFAELDPRNRRHFAAPQSSSPIPPSIWAGILASFSSTWKVKHGSHAQFTTQEQIMGKKLYVGNLSYDVDSSALEQLFTPHGTVESAQIINDRDTGRSKGFGFVEMSSVAEAQAAIAATNGQDNGGRAMTVNEAKPREERPRSGGGGGGGRSRY
jgi:hypothetical protein